MMKKIGLLIALMGGWMLGVHAQSAKLCFVNMPDSLCPLFTAVNRADFVDFLESDMKAIVTNRLGGQSEMTVLAPNFLSIQTSPKSTWQLKVLSVNDSTQVICTVSTVFAPVADSHVRFFTPLWKELPTADYFPADVLKSDQFLFYNVSLNPQEDTLTCQQTLIECKDAQTGEASKPQAGPSQVYVWQQGRFVRKP